MWFCFPCCLSIVAMVSALTCVLKYMAASNAAKLAISQQILLVAGSSSHKVDVLFPHCLMLIFLLCVLVLGKIIKIRTLQM